MESSQEKNDEKPEEKVIDNEQLDKSHYIMYLTSQYRLQDKVLLCLPRPDRRKPKNLRRSRQDEKIKIKNNFVKRDRKFTVLLPYNIGLVNMTHI